MYFFPVRCCLLSLAMGRLKDSTQSLSLLPFIYYTYIHMCQRVGHDFIVVICTCRPDLIDYDMLSLGSHIDNLNNAFHVAEQHLGLPQLLDAEGSYIAELFYLPCICVYIHVIVHRQCDECSKCIAYYSSSLSLFRLIATHIRSGVIKPQRENHYMLCL